MGLRNKFMRRKLLLSAKYSINSNINDLGQKELIISFSGTALLHFHMPHLSFYSVN